MHYGHRYRAVLNSNFNIHFFLFMS
jgi:hypothetical protein